MKDVKMDKMKPSKKGRGLIITAVVVLVLVIACVWYVCDYYRAEDFVDT